MLDSVDRFCQLSWGFCWVRTGSMVLVGAFPRFRNVGAVFPAAALPSGCLTAVPQPQGRGLQGDGSCVSGGRVFRTRQLPVLCAWPEPGNVDEIILPATPWLGLHAVALQ